MKKSTLFYWILLVIPACSGPEFCPEPEQVKSCTKVENWKFKSMGTPTFMLHIKFTDENTGYVGGSSSTLFKTTNGGDSFQSLNIGVSGEDINSLDFIDASTGYVATNIPTLSSGVSHLLKTTDGGQTFTNINIGASMFYRSVRFVNATRAFAGGGVFPYSTAFNGVLMKTTDGGNNWSTVSIPGLKTIYRIHFVNQSLGFFCGDSGQIFRTTDGGDSWTEVTPTNIGAVTAQTNILLTDIFFLNEQTGFCVGGSRAADENFILKTVDGGLTWTRKPSVPSAYVYLYNGVGFSNDKIGYIAGYSGVAGNGTLLSTTDGGETWTLDPVAVPQLTKISVVNCNVKIAGNNSTLITSN